MPSGSSDVPYEVCSDGVGDVGGVDVFESLSGSRSGSVVLDGVADEEGKACSAAEPMTAFIL